jgi:urease accessory protein
MPSEWLIWQMADSAFPAGGFAHSSGLEAAWQSGEVTGAAGLDRFVRDTIEQAGRGGLPLVTAAHAAPERLATFDDQADAFLINAVANRASRVQGRALASTCARIWPLPPLRDLEAQAKSLHGHHAPLVGAAGRALSIPVDVSQRLFLFQAVRVVIAAAVRLGIVGPYEAQRLQCDCADLLNAVHARCRALDERQVTQTAPLIDLLQSTHDRLYSRLFQS